MSKFQVTTVDAVRSQMMVARVDCWPWNDKDAMEDIAAAPADAIVMTSGDHFVGYHVTSKAAAAEILRDGPKANACRIGFDGREQQSAFWVNSVPFIPYCVEQMMPHIDGGDIAILMIVADYEKAEIGYHFEHTWPFPQFALQPEDVVAIAEVAPRDFVRLRNHRRLSRVLEYLEDGLPEYAAYALEVRDALRSLFAEKKAA